MSEGGGEHGDWRLAAQERYLAGATLVHKAYRAYSETWDHDHCAFCWATFVDPARLEDARRYFAEHPDALTAGYATAADHPAGEGYYWVCAACFADFRERFGWRVEGE